MKKNYEALIEVSKQTGTWLKTQSGEPVNLDGINYAKIVPLDAAGKFSVSLFPAQFGEIKRAFVGSEAACNEYLETLCDFVDAKEILIIEKHPCACKCGCNEEVIEGNKFCHKCNTRNHQRVVNYLDDLNKCGRGVRKSGLGISEIIIDDFDLDDNFPSFKNLVENLKKAGKFPA